MSETGTAGAGTDDAAAQATAAAAATAAANAAKPWYDGADAETVGYLQNRGWDKTDAKTAAFEASKAHRAAEKLIGAPADQLLRVPKDAGDAEGWAKFNERMGIITDPAKLDFSAVKFADGAALDDGFVADLKAAIPALKLTKDGATEFAKFIVKQIEKSEATDAAEYNGKLAAERDALKVNWGANANVNKVVAENAAQKLGVKSEELSALEKVVGYSRVMEMFRNIGVRMGEDKFVTGNQAGGSMSVEQATATLAERENDSAWVTKLMAGDAATKQEFQNLTRVKAGQ